MAAGASLHQTPVARLPAITGAAIRSSQLAKKLEHGKAHLQVGYAI